MKMALGAKNKLGIVDGTVVRPPISLNDFQRWLRCDYMVRCWIINSMIKPISEGFLSVDSAKQLWQEIAERYGQSNGPLLFQLKRNLSLLIQGNMSVAEYFNKLKKIWHEIQALQSYPECTCGVLARCTCDLKKKIAEMLEKDRVLEFLMGLNEGFDGLRDHVLTLDPLPNINRVYFLACQVEHKSLAHNIVTGNLESTAMAVNRSIDKPVDNTAQSGKKDWKKIKADRKCTFCHQKGHLMDTCFKLHGLPEWYKEKKAK